MEFHSNHFNRMWMLNIFSGIHAHVPLGATAWCACTCIANVTVCMYVLCMSVCIDCISKNGGWSKISGICWLWTISSIAHFEKHLLYRLYLISVCNVSLCDVCKSSSVAQVLVNAENYEWKHVMTLHQTKNFRDTFLRKNSWSDTLSKTLFVRHLVSNLLPLLVRHYWNDTLGKTLL